MSKGKIKSLSEKGGYPASRVSERVFSNIDDRYIEETLEYLKNLKKRGNAPHRFARYIGAAAVCAVLFFAVSFSALSAAAAAGYMTAYHVLYSVYPQIALNLIPVSESCEDNGILMRVEGADIQGDRADIYISMQDLTGDRIDETIDLFDSYSIYTSCDQSGGCSLVYYDAESKTATFLITVQQMGGKAITGAKLTFGVSEFLSGKTEQDIELERIFLPEAPVLSEVQTDVDIRGSAGSPEGREKAGELSGWLLPDESFAFSPAEGVAVTAYGFIDNRLHIQAYYEDILKYDNHGFLYLTDSKGNVVHPLISEDFWDDERKGSYGEYIFDVSPEDDLTDYTVWGYFNTCRSVTKGRWKVVFSIKQ